MTIFSLKEKNYPQLDKFCVDYLPKKDFDIYIYDKKISEVDEYLKINITKHSFIIVPYISNSIILDKIKVKIYEINPLQGIYLNTLNKKKLNLEAYRVIQSTKFSSLVDYVNQNTGQIRGSVLSYRINDFLTIITTSEIFLWSYEELEEKFGTFISEINKNYENAENFKRKLRSRNQKEIVETILKGSPIPIIVSQFNDKNIPKKAFKNKWKELKRKTIMFSEADLLAAVKELGKLNLLEKKGDMYIFNEIICKESQKYKKFGLKIFE